MNFLVIWMLLLLACLGSSFNALRFRRGGMRHYVRWWRNPNYPAALRNMPIILPAMSVLVAPLVLLVGLLVIKPHVDIVLPGRVVGFLWIGGWGYFFLAFGILVVLSFRPPRRWIPAWLLEKDVRVGWHPPAPDRFDKAVMILLGPPFMLAGIVLLAAAVVVLFLSR